VSSLSGTSLEGSVEAIPHRIFVVYGGVLQSVPMFVPDDIYDFGIKHK